MVGEISEPNLKILVINMLWIGNNSSMNCATLSEDITSDSICILSINILESLLFSKVDIVRVKQFEMWQRTTVDRSHMLQGLLTSLRPATTF